MKRILIVDDSPDNLDVLGLLFESEGFEVCMLNEPSKISRAITDFQPDVMLMDVMLGQENGLTICTEMKRSSLTENLPIVLMSASTIFDGPAVATNFLADAILSKPFDVNKLFNTINNLIEGRQPN